MSLSFKHLTSTKQITRSDADAILAKTKEMEWVVASGGNDVLQGKIVANLFYEPSTRTRMIFASAANRLGAQVISAEGLQFSSMYKGESLEDTITMANQYADLIVMRHPEQGSADRAAAVSGVPFINAGDGPGQHPTQALLDLYTIYSERGTIEDLHIAMVGDLRFGRTVHSLSFLLGLFKGVKFTFISPKELTMPEKVIGYLDEHNLPYGQGERLDEALDADIVYMTRIQQERFADKSEYERLKDSYILEAKDVRGKNCTIMHPLPRLNEINRDVDELPNAAYFRQARNGVYTRMALLSLMLGS